MAGESTHYKSYNDIVYDLCDVFGEAVTDSEWGMTENSKHTLFVTEMDTRVRVSFI